MADDIWKCALIGQGPAGEAIVNTFHYVHQATASDHTGAEFAAAFDAAITAAFTPCVTEDWSEYLCTALGISGVNVGQSGQSTDGRGTLGELGGPSAPLQSAAVGRRRGNGIGRHNRGRCFLSPIPASAIDVDGDFTPPGGMSAAWIATALLTISVGIEVYRPCLYDKVNNQAIIIVAADLGAQVGVQRKRRLRLPN